MTKKFRPFYNKQVSVKQMGRPAPNIDPQMGDKAIYDASKGKKVIAFIEEVYDSCSEKCIIEYTPYMSNLGYGALVVPVDNFSDALKYLSQYVVFFRLGMRCNPGIAGQLMGFADYLRSIGLRIVYYVDDFIFHTNNNLPIQLMNACDATIVSNEVLRDYLRKNLGYQKPISIVLTHLNLEAFDAQVRAPREDKEGRTLILMTSGGRIGTNHTYEICEAFNDDPVYSKKVEFIFNTSGVAQIRSIINKFRNIRKMYVDWIPILSYYQLCKSVDIIINPARIDDLNYLVPPEMQQYWLDSKSCVKYTMAGAARIPIISSPMFSYKRAIKEGVTGFIANTTQEFIDYIKLLTDNPDLRKEIGEAARKDVEKNFDIKDRVHEYIGAITGESEAIEVIAPKNLVFIPSVEGGPRSFYENMKRHLPIVSDRKWEVTEQLQLAKVNIAVAFVAGEQIIQAKMTRNIPYIYRVDGLPMDFNGDLHQGNLKIMQNLFQDANVIVWQSKHCREMWKEKGLIPPGVYTDGPIVHNGVDTNIFKPEGDIYGIPTNKTNLLNINWSTFQHKRIDFLKRLVEVALEKLPNVHFYMLGNYIDTNPIHNMELWQKYPNVTYMGIMKNQSEDAKRIMASIYRAMSGLIFTSEMEGSPNTCWESLACGLPIIYNDRATIIPEICGEACLPFNDETSFIETYKKINSIDRTQLRKIAEANSVEMMVKSYLTYIEGLCIRGSL